MPEPHTLLVCSCDDTMPLDAGALARGCAGMKISSGRQLCRAVLDRFRTLAAAGTPLTLGCTQEAPLFRALAVVRAGAVSSVNLRDCSGGTTEAAQESP